MMQPFGVLGVLNPVALPRLFPKFRGVSRVVFPRSCFKAS